MAKSPVPESQASPPTPDGKTPEAKTPERKTSTRKRKAGEKSKGTGKGGMKPRADEIPPAGKTKAGAKKAGAKAPAKAGLEIPAEPAAGKRKATGKAAGKAIGKKARLVPRKAFLVAATLHDGGTAPTLRVYAAVVRSAEAALAAVRSEVGEAAAVELTGSLSTRMARTLGLAPDEIRQI